MTPWKRFRYLLEEWACRALAWIIPRLSRTACVRLAHVLGALAFRFDRRGRFVASQNLACVFDDALLPERRAAIARASYENFARTMLDLFWAPRLTRENFREWISCEGFDELREKLAHEKRGAVFMCVHQGNWEWASLVFGFLGMPTVIVAESFKNPRLNALFRRVREHSGHNIIGQENSLLRMLRIVKRGGLTGLLIDLSLRPTQSATIVEAFKEEGRAGLAMCVPLLHAVLAERAGALLVPVETLPLPDGSCRVVAHAPIALPPNASLSEIAQRCWKRFEPIVHARPELWLWPYKHFRYRPRSAARPYPAYANGSGAFEKLLMALASKQREG